MAAMAQMQNALRAEIRDLKVKIVTLETAEADNARLRKELSSIKTTCEDEKSKQELDFLNRMADVSRENEARVADLEARLRPKSMYDSTEGMELEQKHETTQIIDKYRDEVDVLQNQLRVVQIKRDELTRKLEEATIELALKDRKLESLGIDQSLADSNPTSNRSFSMEHSSLQRMLREANEEIERLKAEATDQSSIGGQVEVQMQRKVERLERENLKVQDALKQAEHNRKKHDITVLQLERRNHDLKMSIQKMEIQDKNGNLETKACYGFTDEGNLEIEYQRLQSELQKTKSALNLAKLKQEELSYELRKASTANVECSPEVDMLQQGNQSLQAAYKKLEGDVDELKDKLRQSGELKSALLEEISGLRTLLQSCEQDKEKLTEHLAQAEAVMRKQQDRGVDSSQDRTSNMMRQMEQNQKREKANTDNIAANFCLEAAVADTETTEADSSHDILIKLREDNRKLNLDVNQLQRKLHDERKLSRSLRSEIGDMRSSNSTENKPSLRDRASFSSPSISKTQTGNGTTTQTDNSSTRGSVKGIAARFEKGGVPTQSDEKTTPRPSFTKKPMERPTPCTSLSKRSTELSDKVKELNRGLEIERKQVFELEEELTRQCEINGSLLKEINDLSSEIETKRIDCAKHIKISLQSQKDQEEIVHLRSQIIRLSKDLTIASEAKADLQSKCQANAETLSSLQDQVRQKVKDFDKSHSRDEETIHYLQSKVKSLENDLANTLTLVEDLRDKLNSRVENNNSEQHADIQSIQRVLHEKENKISQITREKEQIVLSMNDMTEVRKQELQELQLELTQMKSKNAEQLLEMELLRAKLEKRNYNMQGVTKYENNAAGNLKAENTELRQQLIDAAAERKAAEVKLKQYLNDRGGSSKSVQILRERNAALKFEVEKLTKKLSKLGGSETMQVTRVMI